VAVGRNPRDVQGGRCATSPSYHPGLLVPSDFPISRPVAASSTTARIPVDEHRPETPSTTLPRIVFIWIYCVLRWRKMNWSCQWSGGGLLGAAGQQPVSQPHVCTLLATAVLWLYKQAHCLADALDARGLNLLLGLRWLGMVYPWAAPQAASQHAVLPAFAQLPARTALLRCCSHLASLHYNSVRF
jgi:hypothetical protein